VVLLPSGSSGSQWNKLTFESRFSVGARFKFHNQGLKMLQENVAVISRKYVNYVCDRDQLQE
jgi:hypothetical protein